MTQNPGSSSLSRQKIRRAILVLSVLLVPVTIFYISPIVLMMGAEEGVVTGSFLVYVALFVSSLAAGRIWCGWLCPMGACQEFISPLRNKTVRAGWPTSIKYGFTVLMLGGLIAAFTGAGGIRAVDPFYGIVNGLSVSSLQVLGMVVMIFSAILVFAFITGRRGYCRIVCPMAGIMVAGRKIRNLAGWPALGLGIDSSRCIDCGKCSKKCPMGLDVHAMVRQGKVENADCILCASCADNCPEGVIRYSVAGT